MVRVRVAKCMNRTLPTRKVIWRVSSLVTLPLISTGREICVQQGHWWRHSACLFKERNSPGKEHLSSTMFYWGEHLSLTSRPLITRGETGLVHHMERAAEENSFIAETIGWLTNIISYIISTRCTQVLCWLPDPSVMLVFLHPTIFWLTGANQFSSQCSDTVRVPLIPQWRVWRVDSDWNRPWFPVISGR